MWFSSWWMAWIRQETELILMAALLSGSTRQVYCLHRQQQRSVFCRWTTGRLKIMLWIIVLKSHSDWTQQLQIILFATYVWLLKHTLQIPVKKTKWIFFQIYIFLKCKYVIKLVPDSLQNSARLIWIVLMNPKGELCVYV